MEMSNITTIYKKKGSKHDLENDRGIFGLSVFRKIIDNLVYQEKYPLIDMGMQEREKNIKSHLFIVYGIMNSVLKGEVIVSIYISTTYQKLLMFCGWMTV